MNYSFQIFFDIFLWHVATPHSEIQSCICVQMYRAGTTCLLMIVDNLCVSRAFLSVSLASDNLTHITTNNDMIFYSCSVWSKNSGAFYGRGICSLFAYSKDASFEEWDVQPVLCCGHKRPSCTISLLFMWHIGLQFVTVKGHVCYHDNKPSFVVAAGFPIKAIVL